MNDVKRTNDTCKVWCTVLMRGYSVCNGCFLLSCLQQPHLFELYLLVLEEAWRSRGSRLIV